jgi:hypothetical protein
MNLKNNHKKSITHWAIKPFFKQLVEIQKFATFMVIMTLMKSEYMEITTDIPDCEYWNFQLENYWMESLDYRHNPIHINESYSYS